MNRGYTRLKIDKGYKPDLFKWNINRGNPPGTLKKGVPNFDQTLIGCTKLCPQKIKNR